MRVIEINLLKQPDRTSFQILFSDIHCVLEEESDDVSTSCFTLNISPSMKDLTTMSVLVRALTVS